MAQPSPLTSKALMSTLSRWCSRAPTISRTLLEGEQGMVCLALFDRKSVYRSSPCMSVAGPDPAAAKTLLRTLDDAEHLAHKVKRVVGTTDFAGPHAMCGGNCHVAVQCCISQRPQRQSHSTGWRRVYQGKARPCARCKDANTRELLLQQPIITSISSLFHKVKLSWHPEV